MTFKVHIFTVNPNPFNNSAKLSMKKIIVFKKAQKPEINGYTYGQPYGSRSFCLTVFNLYSGKEIQSNGKHQEKQKPKIPTTIEIEAGYKQKYILILIILIAYKPV